jgi:hypothetical protein
MMVSRGVAARVGDLGDERPFDGINRINRIRAL